MHYKNGRVAKNGDQVVSIPTYGPVRSGILYGAVAGNDTCNGNLAQPSPNDPIANLSECLHVDDIGSVGGNIPDSTLPVEKTPDEPAAEPAPTPQ